MASKGPRSRLDHDSRAKRQKALEAPKEPPRPKAHWDHVLEEMVWLSKDFEAERKWKMSLAKRVALRATKSFSDHATKGEKKIKEEEQRLRKVALNISKDVKKFWTKIEKLVIYKYQLEAEERKKKAMDKQLNFLLDQTERYSTMLAENLVSNQPSSSNQEEPKAKHDMEIANDRSLELDTNNATMLAENLVSNLPSSSNQEEEKEKHDMEIANDRSENLVSNQPSSSNQEEEKAKHDMKIANDRYLELDNLDSDDEYENQSDDEIEDDERTIEEDEAKITEAERREELAALEAEADLPLEEILKAYSKRTTRLAFQIID